MASKGAKPQAHESLPAADYHLTGNSRNDSAATRSGPGMDDAAARRDKAFLGHPIGLGWLSASEFWERFAYYGTQSILVLFLTHYLLQPGHVENIVGFAAFRRFVETFYGALPTPQALAAAITGLYSGLVYLTPILGGILADRVLGRTWTVALGAALMVGGYFMLAFDAAFVLAVLLLLIGVGCFKGNIATQVGDLYSHDDSRRADAFQVYFLGIQLAVIVAPLACGTLGEKFDWHWGFAAGGVAMVLGLIVYLCGLHSFPKEAARKNADAPARPPLTRRDWITVAILVAMLPVLALSLVSNQEIFVAYLVWAEKNFQIVFFGQAMPISWMLSVDAIVSTFLIAGVIAFWRWYGRRWSEPDEITKITIGTAISACAPLVLAAASAVVASTGHPVSLAWAVAFHVINDLGFANVLPVGLALYSRAAPKGLGGMMIAVYYVHLFFGNALIGKIGGLLGRMPDVQFWLMHAGLMAVAVVLLVLVRLIFGRMLAPSYETPHVTADATT
jgi:POT family proton-dependent oligopeptide transporter